MTPDTVTLTLPYPPSTNHYWRHVGPRVLISTRGRQYRQEVGRAVLLRGRTGLPLSGRLAVSVVAHPPDRRRRDLDNLLKSLLDALRDAGVYDDDEQIDSLLIRRGAVLSGGGVVVGVGALDREE